MASKVIWDPEFTPSYTPVEMLTQGVFEGKYINIIEGIPKSWTKLPKVLGKKDKPDPTLNAFGVMSRQPLSVWKENKWIKTDKGGWFHWYVLYWLGRRLGEEDKWQINRWKSFCARHQGQIVASGDMGKPEARKKQRQALLQWGWDSKKAFDEKNRRAALRRLSRSHGEYITLESAVLPIEWDW